MNTLSGAKMGAISPLAIGLFVAGVLMFVVIAIVRSVTAQPSDIGATTAASLTAIPWDHIPVSNNVAAALPAFSIQKPPGATVVSVFDNQATGVTLLEVPHAPAPVAPIVNLSWATRSWMAIARAADGSEWVYGDAWFSCQHIDKSALAYLGSADDPALAVWNQLAPRKQSELAKECQS